MGLYGLLWSHFHRKGDDMKARDLLRYMAGVLLMVISLTSLVSMLLHHNSAWTNYQGFITPNVANAAHVGGFLAGALLTVLVVPVGASEDNSAVHNRLLRSASVPIVGLVAAVLVAFPAARNLLWQLPCALYLHVTSPGLLARGASPALALPQAIRPYFVRAMNARALGGF